MYHIYVIIYSIIYKQESKAADFKPSLLNTSSLTSALLTKNCNYTKDRFLQILVRSQRRAQIYVYERQRPLVTFRWNYP